MSTKHCLCIVLVSCLLTLSGCVSHNEMPSNISISSLESQTISSSMSSLDLSKNEWDDEKDVPIIEDLIKQAEKGDGYGKSDDYPLGTYRLYYPGHNSVLAPVAAFSDSSLYEQYPLLKADPKARMSFFISDAITAIAYSATADKNPLTVIFSTDRGENWERTEINIEPMESHVDYSICYSNQSTGYLLVTYGVDRDGQTVGTQGCIIYKTTDSGKSWLKVSELRNISVSAIYTQDDIVFLTCDRENLPFLLKSQDCSNWAEINLPLPEYYSSGFCSEMRFEDNYGVVKTVVSTPEQSTKVYFVTKDFGDTWVLWN